MGRNSFSDLRGPVACGFQRHELVPRDSGWAQIKVRVRLVIKTRQGSLLQVHGTRRGANRLLNSAAGYLVVVTGQNEAPRVQTHPGIA